MCVAKSLHVLVVEPAEISRAVLAQALRDEGHVVDEAAAGDQAEQLLAVHDGEYHLLVTNEQLDDRSGQELVNRFKHAAAQPAKVVVISRGPVDHRKVRANGSILNLTIPFTPQEFLNRLKDLLAS